MIELALVLPVVLVLTLGVIDFGRAYVVGIGVQQGAREGARFASNVAWQSGLITDTAVIQRLVDASMPALQGCSTTGISTGVGTSTVSNQSCGYGTWTFTVTCLRSSVACTTKRVSGDQVTVKATGSVPLLIGYLAGAFGVGSLSITGEATFPVL